VDGRLRLRSLALVAVVLAAAPAVAQRNIPPDYKPSPEGNYTERRLRSIEERVQRGEAYFEQRRQAAKPGDATRVRALESLKPRIPAQELVRKALACGCAPLEIHRTFGEMQTSFPVDLEAEKNGTLDSALAGGYVSFLATRLEESAEEAKAEPPSKYDLQRDRFYREALAEARSGIAPANGLLVEATFDQLTCLRSALGASHRATEIMPGRVVYFAIPLEVYGQP
jgi:hypothetical protein